MPGPQIERPTEFQNAFDAKTAHIDWGDDADEELACPINPDGPCEVCD